MICETAKKYGEALVKLAEDEEGRRRHTHVYLALYNTNDSRARKECNVTLLHGLHNDKAVKESGHKRHSPGKYIDLPCPVCGFVHGFKRVTWWENLALPVPPTYFDEEEME